MVQLTRDRSKIRPAEARVGNVKHDSVEEVEGFGTELKESRLSKAYVECPEQGKVNIFVGVRDIRVHLLSAVCVRRLDRERVDIEPLGRSVESGPFIGIADHVDSLLQAAANVLGVAAIGYGVRQPGT